MTRLSSILFVLLCLLFATSIISFLLSSQLPRVWRTVSAQATCYVRLAGSRAALAIHQKQTKDMLIVSRNMMRCESATCWNKSRLAARAWLDIAIMSATASSVPATADSGVRNLCIKRIMSKRSHVSRATAI